jgi:hypothetical protein
MDIHTQRVHVGEPFLRSPAHLRGELLASSPDDGILSTTGVGLTPQGVPVACALGGPPEALGRDMGVNIDTAHALSSWVMIDR